MRESLRILVWVLLAYLLLSFESPMLTSFHIRMYAPDPALAIIVYGAAGLAFLPGILLSAALGLLKDGFSGGVPVGMYVEIYTLVFMSCFALARRFDYRNVVLMTLVTMGASLMASLLFFVLSAIFDRDFEDFDMIFRLTIPQALITAPMGPIVAGILNWMDQYLVATDRDGLFR